MIFEFSVHAVTSVITNSSSELFVLEGKKKEILESIISNQYPDYLNEYEELTNSWDLSDEQLSTYVEYRFSKYEDRDKPKIANICNVPHDEMWEVVEYNYGRGPSYSRYFNPDCRNKFLRNFDPLRRVFFLFSRYENPNWDYQQKLEMVGTRYHLG